MPAAEVKTFAEVCKDDFHGTISTTDVPLNDGGYNTFGTCVTDLAKTKSGEKYCPMAGAIAKDDKCYADPMIWALTNCAEMGPRCVFETSFQENKMGIDMKKATCTCAPFVLTEVMPTLKRK